MVSLPLRAEAEGDLLEVFLWLLLVWGWRRHGEVGDAADVIYGVVEEVQE